MLHLNSCFRFLFSNAIATLYFFNKTLRQNCVIIDGNRCLTNNSADTYWLLCKQQTVTHILHSCFRRTILEYEITLGQSTCSLGSNFFPCNRSQYALLLWCFPYENTDYRNPDISWLDRPIAALQEAFQSNEILCLDRPVLTQGCMASCALPKTRKSLGRASHT